MNKTIEYPKDYAIDGLKVVSYSKKQTHRTKNFSYCTEAVAYHTSFCRITIAQDVLGIQICSRGVFFGESFQTFSEGVEYLRKNKDSAVKVYRKVFFEHIFSDVHWKFFSKTAQKHIHYGILHFFNKNLSYYDYCCSLYK